MSIENIQRELDKARGRIRELETDIKDLLGLRERAETAEEKADFFKKELALLQAQKKNEATHKAKEHIDSLKEESESLKLELGQVETRLDALMEELKEAKQRAKQAEANVALLSTQLEQKPMPLPTPPGRVRKSKRP